MQSDCPRPDFPRIVKPRKERGNADRPIIAVHETGVLTEDGKLFDYSELPTLIVVEPPSIVVTHHAGHMLRDLDKVYRSNEKWQFRVAPVEREVWSPNGKSKKATVKDTTVAFFGFQRNGKQAGHYHYPVSPMTFCLQTANAIRRGVPENNATLYKLMEWGKDLREFLIANKLRVSPTSGGVAAQLLKDKRFYPVTRRKVPKVTNALAREHLPGNFYRLYGATLQTPYKATYLDQQSAHHSIAKRLAFPDANTLKKRGRYNSLNHRAYVRHSSKHFSSVISEHGLFLLGVRIPQRGRGTHFLPPAVDKEPGLHYVYLFSNELEYVQSYGIDIECVVAHWTSPDTESGLNRYAEWALEQIAEAEFHRRKWLKPMLLSTYGVLAARPREPEFGYARAKNSETKQYPCGSGFLSVEARRSMKAHEMTTANVIHRGMIEAETRLVSLRLAKDLHSKGHNVLAIYADSVFVESTDKLPLLAPPWKVEAHLTALRFLSPVAFRSMELEKLPGVPKVRRSGSRRIAPVRQV